MIRLLTRAPFARTAAKPRRCRPQVDNLEDRVVPSAASSFQDNFNDNALDNSAWVVGTEVNPGPLPIRERNGRIEFVGPGAIVTRQEFPPEQAAPLEVTGVFSFSPSLDLIGPAQVVTRSDIDLRAPEGVEFTLDPVWGVRITVWESGAPTVLAQGRLDIDPGDSFHFRIRDDGERVSISVGELGGDEAAMSLTADTRLASDGNHVAFRYAGVSFGPVARLALDDVTLGPPTAGPAPTPVVVPVLPGIVVLLDGESEASRGREDVTPQLGIHRGRVRMNSRTGRARLRLTIRNTTGRELSNLRLVLAGLPRGARVRIGEDNWMSVAQVARQGIDLGEQSDLRPGEVISFEVEITRLRTSRLRVLPRVVSSNDPADDVYLDDEAEDEPEELPPPGRGRRN